MSATGAGYVLSIGTGVGIASILVSASPISIGACMLIGAVSAALFCGSVWVAVRLG